MGNRESAIAERLLRWKREYREGNKERCLDVIWICLQFNHAVPQWAIEHFISSMWRHRSAEAWTLDEAFGIQRPKGQKKARARQRFTRGLVAHITARGLHDSKNKTLLGKPYSVDEAIAKVAQKLSMSDSDMERWYYDPQLMKELGYPPSVRRKSKKTEGD